MLQELAVLESPWDFLLNKNIILYGAGAVGEWAHTELVSAGIPVTAFCDSNPDKVGTTFCGVPVIGSEDLKRQDVDNSLLVISASATSEIYDFLQKDGIWGGSMCSSFAVSAGLWYSMQEEEDVPKGAEEYWIRKKKFIKLVSIYAKNNAWNETACVNYLEMRKILFRKLDHLYVAGPYYLIYQPGKVASSSINNELRRLGKNTFHAHSIEQIGSEEEQEFLRSMLQEAKMKVVTGVREPVGRGISKTFHHCSDLWISRKPGESFFDSIKTHMALGTPLVKEYFTTDNFYSYESTERELTRMFDWFDERMKRDLGVDIFEEPFDKEKGYAVIKKGNIEIFVYKTEKLRGLENELREFLEVEDFCFRQDNDAKNKPYSLLYQYVKENIKFSKEFLDFYYCDERMKHFYTDEEIEQFRKKWREEE